MCRPRLTLSQRFFFSAILAIGCALASVGVDADPLHASEMAADLPTIIHTHTAHLAKVTSDAAALSLYKAHLGKALDLPHTLSLRAKRDLEKEPAHNPIVKNLEGLAVRLTAELSAWELALTLRKSVESEGNSKLKEFMQTLTPRYKWLKETTTILNLDRALNVGRVIVSFNPFPNPLGSLPTGFGDVTRYLDRTYPQLTGSDTSWLTLAEREGAQGIRRRLSEFREQLPSSHSDHEMAALLFFHTRLRPVLLAQAVALSIRAQADAEERASGHWLQLYSVGEGLKQYTSRARLCGVWIWSVHTHHNHRDHKMMMRFHPEGSQEGTDPRPSRIVVLGDTVYLRWEFPGGYQEDSLLFTGNGKRLEGTFRNSMGPRGTITGTRTAPCLPSKKKQGPGGRKER